MDEVELTELATLLDNSLAAGEHFDPLEPAVSANADRLAILLAETETPDPAAAATLILYLWRRFWALPVGMALSALDAAARLAARLSADRRSQVPDELQALLAVDPLFVSDPDQWCQEALAANSSVDPAPGHHPEQHKR